jgi:hypothetical protein
MLRAKPQRHRGTETAQSHPPGVCLQITQIAIATQRKDAKTQRRKARKERRGAEAQRRRENPRQPDHPARSRPPGGRGPLGRATVPNASVRRSHSTQRPALSESTGLASRVDQNLAFEQARMRRDRRAASASAGAKTVWDERLRSEQTGFAPGAGDHRIAGVAAAPFQATSPTPAALPLRLCVFAFLHSFLPGWAALRLCAFAPLRFLPRVSPFTCVICSFSENVVQHSEFRIPNSEFS